jgi:hypothetical protein
MDSSMINKIMKAKRYAEQRDRINFSGFRVTFRGNHREDTGPDDRACAGSDGGACVSGMSLGCAHGMPSGGPEDNIVKREA